MKDTIKKGLALGLGLAVVTKEQAEKVVDDLVEKGELSKQESREFVDDLVKRGQTTKNVIDEKINEKMDRFKADMNVATQDELDDLKKRIEELEAKVNQE